MGDKIKAFFTAHAADVATVLLVFAALLAAFKMGELAAREACGNGFSLVRYDRP